MMNKRREIRKDLGPGYAAIEQRIVFDCMRKRHINGDPLTLSAIYENIPEQFRHGKIHLSSILQALQRQGKAKYHRATKTWRVWPYV